MGFLSLTKIVSLVGAMGAIATVAVKVAPTKTSNTRINAHNQDTYSLSSIRLTKDDCYIVETSSNHKEKLLVCNNSKYYMHNSDSNSLTELKNLKTKEGNQITSQVVNLDGSETDKTWTMTDPAWKKFPKDINLGLKNESKPISKGYCSISHVLDHGGGTNLICYEASNKNLGSIKLIPLI